MFTTKFWLIITAFLLLLMFISTLVAYFRGKKRGQETAKPPTQYDHIADDKTKEAREKAEAEIKAIEAEAKKKRDELDAVMSIKSEEDRLKALAAMANKWKLP